MKRLFLILMILAIHPSFAFTQEDEDRPPREQNDRRNRDNESLTAEQKETVKSILSKYDAAALTAEDARAIQDEFRKAGLRGGPAMRETIEEAGFDFDRLRELAPPPGKNQKDKNEQQPSQEKKKGKKNKKDKPESRGQEDRRQGDREGSQKYSIEQAISDRAQLHTIAFSGLAFITGDFGASTFIPPGKVCDFFGFQYMRDIDAAGKGHNPMFLNRVAGNVLYILNEQQKKLFLDLASEQAQELDALARMRLPIIKAFCVQLENKIPQGSSGLNKQAVIQYVGDIFAKDAELSLKRAEVMAKVANSLTPEQKVYLGKMKFGDFNTWPEMDERDKLKQKGKGKSKLFNVAYMTYASEFFSWTAGSVEADTYFCPERHGTYFGGFYMKDMPAMGKRDYDISTSVTGDSGESFINDVLTEKQRCHLTEIPDKQRKAMKEIVDVRREISQELRKLLQGKNPDQAKVMSLGRRYGELDGELSWYYAMAFARINRTLLSQQRAALNKLRNLEGYTSAPYYIYSQAMKDEPELSGVNNLFFEPKQSSQPPMDSNRPSRTDSQKQDRNESSRNQNRSNTFILRSSGLGNDGILPKEFTGDGTSATLPLEWSGAPSGSKSFAIIMHHIDPKGRAKWYWILYNIPGNLSSIPKNVRGVGTLGNNSINGRTEYAPPHSKGPGQKTYIYTIYALSSQPQITVSADRVNRDVLFAAIKDFILGSAELQVVYTRSGGNDRPNKDMPNVDRERHQPNRDDEPRYN